jgi:hypothetical protein
MNKLDKFRVNGKFHLLMQVEGRVQVQTPSTTPDTYALILRRLSLRSLIHFAARVWSRQPALCRLCVRCGGAKKVF